MRRLSLAAASIVGALLSTALRAQAQVLADRVPADAIVYAGWAGSDSLGAAYNGSNLKAFHDAVKLQQLIDALFQQNQANRQLTPQQRQDAATVQDLLAALAKSPTAVFMQPFDFPENAPPAPRVALISRLAPGITVDIPAISAMLQRGRSPNAPTARAAMNGEYLVILLGKPDISDLRKPAPDGGLAASPNFQKALRQLGPQSAQSPAIGYIDATGAVKTLGNAVDQSGNAQAQRLLGPLVDGFGLGGLTQAAFSGNFDGPDWRGHLFVGMDQKRGGFLFLLDSPALPEVDLKLIPKAATTAGAVRFDGVKFLQVLAEAAGVNGQQRVDQGLNQIWAFTGIDFKNDLLPGLGDAFVYYDSPAAAGNSIRGLTFLNRLRDTKKGQAAMGEIESFINAALLQRDPKSPQFITQPLHDPLGNVTAHVIHLPQVSPAWAIHDRILFFSLSVPALEDAIAMTAAGKESILDNPLFAATRRKLGERPFSSFTFEDLRGSAPDTYEMISRAISRTTPLTANHVFTLPPLDQITPTLGPAMDISWSDADGFHMQSISPFPGAGYLNPIQLIALSLNRQQNAAFPAGPAPARGHFPAPGDTMP